MSNKLPLRRPGFACILLGCCLLASAVATAVYGAGAVDALRQQSTQELSGAQISALNSRLNELVAQRGAELATRDFIAVADTFGNLVSKARDAGVDRRQFNELLRSAQALREQCRNKIRALERATGDNESALEMLYRSDDWHDINYALSAFGYWEAWTLLGLAQTYVGEREQAGLLNRAERGFQGSAVRILYPGIVYGSWLGIGYVAMARHEEHSAEGHFRRLSDALRSDPDNPVRRIADTELAVLALRRGQDLSSLPPVGTLDGENIALVQEQAFALLERQRKTKSGAIGAAQRLKPIVESAFLNDALVQRIFSYRDEIVGQDLGVFSLLVDSEYAYAYQQYNTAVFKFREFLKRGGAGLPITLDLFRYHYAVALLKSGLPRDALQTLRELDATRPLSAAVAGAIPKLSFLVAQTLYQQKPDKAREQQLVQAAQRFLQSSPEDGDIGSAHLVLAQFSTDQGAVQRHLSAAKQDRRLVAGISLTRLQRELVAFNQAARNGEADVQSRLASAILQTIDSLPRRERNKPWFMAVALQMRTFVGEGLSKTLADIDALAIREGLDDHVRALLLWSKLRALDGLGPPQRVAEFIAQLTKQPIRAGQQREIYQFLLEKERAEAFTQVADLAARFYPALAGQPQDQRQLQLLRIRALTAGGDGETAFAAARDMVAAFPDSGDGWVAYAEAAQASNRPFEAERGWAKITGAVPDGSPRWLEGMVRRLGLLASLAEAGAAQGQRVCELAGQVNRYQHNMAQGLRAEFEKTVQGYRCPEGTQQGSS